MVDSSLSQPGSTNQRKADSLINQVKTLYSFFKPSAKVEGFCWRLLFPANHKFQLDLAETPFIPVDTIKMATGFDTTRRLKFEIYDELVHVYEHPDGCSAAELVRNLPNEVMVGGNGISVFSSLLSATTIRSQILNTIWKERATYDSFLDVSLRAAVKAVPFQTWDDLHRFQEWTGGWCYLRLVSKNPKEASINLLASGRTMTWDSIYSLSEGKGSHDVKFDYIVHRGARAGHIIVHLGGHYTLETFRAVLTNEAIRNSPV